MTRALVLLLAALVPAQDSGTTAVLEKFRAARPADSELGIYRLTWTATLREARERASKEGRPIFLLVCTNSYGNMFTGHC